MPFTGDERQISLEEVVSAAVTHELPILVERLARERAWGSLVVVFGYAGGRARRRRSTSSGPPPSRCARRSGRSPSPSDPAPR